MPLLKKNELINHYREDEFRFIYDIRKEMEDEEEMPEISILEVHHKLPEPKMYNRNSLPNAIIKRSELFRKVKKYAICREKSIRNDADVVL